MKKESKFTPVVTSGVTVVGETVDGGQIIDGGTAIQTIIISGGLQQVSNGMVSMTTINDDGAQNVQGGIVTSTTINCGAQILTGGTVAMTKINSGGEQSLRGGTVISTTINDGGRQIVDSGTVTSTTVNGGGQQVINSGAVSATTVNAGGFLRLNVDSGATAINVTLNPGYAIVAGTNNSLTTADGSATIAGGTATKFTLYADSIFEVPANGKAISMTINDGGYLQVDGGVASDITVNNNGCLEVTSGGTAVSGIILDTGFNLIADTRATFQAGSMSIKNGTATNVTLNNEGYLVVSAGGLAISTTVNGGCDSAIEVMSGGSATATTVNSQGAIVVRSGGTASNTTIKSGGYLLLESGARVTNLVLSGGSVVLYRGNGSLYGGSGGYTIDSLTVMGSGAVGVLAEDTAADHSLTINSLTGSVNFVINTDLANGQADTIAINNATASAANKLQVNYDPVYLTGGSVTGSKILATVLRGSAGFTAVPTSYGTHVYSPTITVAKSGAATMATLTKLDPIGENAQAALSTVMPICITEGEIRDRRTAYWRGRNRDLVAEQSEKQG